MTIRRRPRPVVLFTLNFLLFTAFPVHPQDLLDDAEVEFADSIELFGDLRLRGDFVSDLPRPVDKDFERGMARLRAGAWWRPLAGLEFGLAGKGNLGTDGDSKTRSNLDNELADDIALDELYLSVEITDSTGLLVGQTLLPLELTPMVWDHDLRPQGVSMRHRFDVGTFNSVETTGGVFRGNHLYGDNSQIRALQSALRFGEGTDYQYDLVLSYLDFNDLDKLGQEGLGRTNLLAPDGGLAHDFNLADVQFSFRFGLAGFPLTARANAVKNLAVGEDGWGGRIDLVIGDSLRNEGFELGFATQRIQREALVGAFGDDDWWFRTRMRGSAVWLGWGFSESLRLRVSGFSERLDVAPDRNERILLDLEWFF